jgi:predicted kinase
MEVLVKDKALIQIENKILYQAYSIRDIGKIISNEGHEGISFYMANSIVKENKTKVAKIVALHETALKNKEKFLTLNSFEDFVRSFKFSYDLDDYENLLKLMYLDIKNKLETGKVSQENIKILLKIERLLETKKDIQLKEDINPNKPNLYILIGVQNSGKSTFIRDNLTSKCMVISRDKILLEVVKKHSKQDLNYTQAFKYALNNNLQKIIDKELKKQISTLENYDNHVAVDMMNLTLKSRKKFFNRFKDKFNIVYVIFYTGIQHIFERNINRKIKEGKYISDKVILNSMKNFSYPINEPFNKLIEVEN